MGPALRAKEFFCPLKTLGRAVVGWAGQKKTGLSCDQWSIIYPSWSNFLVTIISLQVKHEGDKNSSASRVTAGSWYICIVRGEHLDIATVERLGAGGYSIT